jgi:integrase
MAAFNRLPSGYWRVQVRRKGQYASRTFRLKFDAEQWALEAERAIAIGKTVNAPHVDGRTAFGTLIALHIADMAEVGKAPLRSKAKSLDKLDVALGNVVLGDLTRERLIEFGKARAKEGAGPVTLGIDIGYIRTVLVHAAAIHGINVPTEQVTLARVALRRLGLIGKGNERDRRPTQDELDCIIRYHDNNSRQIIPLSRIVKFAVATAMRQEEICRLRWPDIDLKARIAIVRDRKDPRRKGGNDQRVPLLAANGYDPVTLLQEQRSVTPSVDLVFPYNSKSLGTAFRRVCRALGIADLHFHDLRHEATSRLFEAGYDIPEVSLVTGHKDWKMLRRYLNLRPHQLVGLNPAHRRYPA